MTVADLLPYLPSFLAVCDALSFSQAAARLGVTTAAVSKAVQRLEEEIGAPLLVRTTRSVTVTRQGQQVREHFQQALVEVQAARALIDRAKTEPSGALVLHTSSVLSAAVLQAVSSLCARHPLLVPRILYGDRRAKPGEEDVDVAVRLGPVGDDRLVARPLGSLPFVTVASPAYLGRRGTPASVAALVDHHAVLFVAPRGSSQRRWRFVEAGVEVFGAPQARAHVDHGPSLVEAALLGLGLVQVFEPMVRAHLEAGRLVRVLEEVTHEARPLHAVTTPQKARTVAVRSVVDCLRAAFATPDARAS